MIDVPEVDTTDVTGHQLVNSHGATWDELSSGLTMSCGTLPSEQTDKCSSSLELSRRYIIQSATARMYQCFSHFFPLSPF